MKHFIFPLFSLFSATGTVSFSLCYVVPGSSCYSIDRKNPPNKIAKSPLKNTNSAVENWLSSELEKFCQIPVKLLLDTTHLVGGIFSDFLC